jgi:hypothetical protein
MNILVAISNPQGLCNLDLAREKASIQEAWGAHGNARLEFLEFAQVEELQAALYRGPFHGFHFMGHGVVDPSTGEGRLLFESKDRSPNPLSGETLAMLLKDERSLRFAFLNACDTARSPVEGEADALTGVAAALVQGGVPAVLAMQFSVSDKAAIKFSQGVHERLAVGATIEASVAAGRRAVYTENRDSLEWAIPVLFSRVRDGYLFDTPPAPDEAEKESSARVAKIEGIWFSEIMFLHGERNKHRMELKQEGIDITGETHIHEGYGEGNRYQLKGTLTDRIFSCFYRIKDDLQFEQGSMILMLGRNGRSLKGYLTYYDDLAESILTTPCEWKREPFEIGLLRRLYGWIRGLPYRFVHRYEVPSRHAGRQSSTSIYCL